MAEPQAPEQVDGLLEKIADTALDDDYYVVRSGPYEQSREFNTVLTGIVLAKLDGTAKGGIVFAIAQELKLPIKYIGTGEKIDDFAEFDAHEFVEDLFEG